MPAEVERQQIAPASAAHMLPTRRDVLARVRLLVSGEVWRATAYLLLNWALGIFWLAALLTLFALGIGLAYTIIGLLILALTMRIWMGGAALERWRARHLLGLRIESPYRPLPERGILARVLARAGDPAVWRDLLYLVLLLPLGVMQGTLLFAAWALLLAGLSMPIYIPYYWLTMGPVPPNMLGTLLLLLLAGIALALVLPGATLAVSRAHGWLALRLLGPHPGEQESLAAQVGELRESRARLLDAALLERRRIERDLHDGAQQRLVAVAMGLGMARQKMESDPRAAAALVAEAHEETKQVIREIRDLVRGIHPALLSDRGLDAAISALAGRSSVPVEVEVVLDHRPPEAVEATAYFVVAEALTNVAKHSRATRARIRVYCRDRRLKLEVGDDGVGGAAACPGSGLAGLMDRVAASDGRLTIDSPAGGPTRIEVELPCV